MYLSCDICYFGSFNKGRSVLNALIIEKVTQFPERDNNCRMPQGKHDNVAIKVNGTKLTFQKRHLFGNAK